MATYGGITFRTMAPSGIVPDWTSETQIARRHIPNSDTENLQFMGRGNYKISVICRFASQVDRALMRQLAGDGIGRTLADFLGETHSDVILVNVKNPQRLATNASYILAELEFERTFNA